VHQAKAMNDLIYSVCRDVVWRTTKFITSVPQENRFAKAILDNLDIPGYQGPGAVVATARASWLAIYQDRCLNKLNCAQLRHRKNA
jgi:hypothetical protein